MSIDLDAARAARREAQGIAPSFVLDGETYTLPVELPFVVIEAMRGLGDQETAAASLADLATALLGEHFQAVRGKLSMADFGVLIEGLLAEYGVDAPLASSAS